MKSWISTILPLYPYRPLLTTSDAQSTGSINDNSVRTGKYSKIFAPTLDTDPTANESFDPSTITPARTTRPNAWNNGPPLNVTFDRRSNASRTGVLRDPTQANSTRMSYAETQRVHHDASAAEDDNSDTTPLTRPSATFTPDISDLIAQALSAKRAALDKRLYELEQQQLVFLEKTAQWEQKLADMKRQIVDATVSGTISVLTGTSSPFATKADVIKQREENIIKFQSLKEGMTSTSNGVAVLQENMHILLQRTEQLFVTKHDPDIKSPPRKSRVTDTLTLADSPMHALEGDGES